MGGRKEDEPHEWRGWGLKTYFMVGGGRPKWEKEEVASRYKDIGVSGGGRKKTTEE